MGEVGMVSVSLDTSPGAGHHDGIFADNLLSVALNDGDGFLADFVDDDNVVS
jgi:hypothetical protein